MLIRGPCGMPWIGDQDSILERRADKILGEDKANEEKKRNGDGFAPHNGTRPSASVF